jgi:hypothetical protein
MGSEPTIPSNPVRALGPSAWALDEHAPAEFIELGPPLQSLDQSLVPFDPLGLGHK